MEYSTFEFLKSTKQRFEEFTNQLTSFIPLMASLFERTSRVINFLLGEKTALLEENAQLKDQLAQALANDRADAEAILAAQVAADAARDVAADAKAKSAELQTLVDADVAEDEQIIALLDATLPSEPTV